MTNRDVDLDNPLAGDPGNYSAEYTMECMSCSVVCRKLVNIVAQTLNGTNATHLVIRGRVFVDVWYMSQGLNKDLVPDAVD
jgi:hypothetical protein